MNQSQLAVASVRWLPFFCQTSIHSVVVVLLLGVYSLIVPRFALTFDEFDLMLPAPSVLVVNLSHYLVGRWILAMPIVLLLLACDITVLAALRVIPKAGPILSTLWFLLMFALLGLIVLITVVGLYLPISAAQTELATL